MLGLSLTEIWILRQTYVTNDHIKFIISFKVDFMDF